MLRSSLFTACAFALVAGASAQTPQALTAEKMPTALKHAGIFHVQSGTWTRTGGQVANFGPDVVYSNTADSGYFSSAGGAGGFAPNSENYDEGGIPGTTNGNPFTVAPNRDEYSVNCIQIGYCDLGAAGSGGWTLNFYNSYAPCTVNAAPDSTVIANGLPANGGCWLVTLDITGTEICIDADGGSAAPGWDNDPNLDSFGWSYTYSGTDGAAGNNAGFLLSGNPMVTDPTFVAGGLAMDGSNTYYGATNCAGVGSGYLGQDFWWLEDPTAASSNCYFFGGYSNNNGSCTGPSNPFASWFMELSADTGPCGTTVIGTVYCNSNPNSTGVNTCCQILGSPFAADNSLEVRAFKMPLNAFGFFIVSETPGFVANPNGSQGNLCVLGAIGRFVGPGQIMSSGATGEMSLMSDTSAGGVFDLFNMPTPTGPRASVAGTTDHFQLWHRDLVGGVPTSNFSDAGLVTWQ